MTTRMISNMLLFLVCYSIILIPQSILANPEIKSKESTDPLWEIGAVLGGSKMPAYKGSEGSKEYYLIFPYFVYRGDILNVDRESITGRFFKSEKLEANTSIFIDINDNDAARFGMPDLDPVILAVGPTIKYFFRRSATAGYDFYLDFPIRAAISGNDDFNLTYRGLQAKINLHYKNKKMFGSPKCELGIAGGIAFYNSELADYYYGVDDEYITSTRPQFDAEAGYAGASVSLDLMYNFTDWLAIRSYTRLDLLHGSSFEDSPLMNESVTTVVGLALIVSLWQSDERVPR